MLAAVWLLLQERFVIVDLLWAVVIALLVPHLVYGFLGPPVRPRRLGVIVFFAAIVLWDIVVSNLVVARLVLSPRSRPKPAWVPVHTELSDPLALSLLATVITMTPGTVSCVIDEARGVILVHALDCADPEALAAQMKARYEAPLRRIFEEEDT